MGSALRKTSLQFLRLTSTTRTTGRAGGGDRFNSVFLSLKNIVIVTPFLTDAKTRRRPRLWQCGCEGCEGEGCCRGWALPPTCSGGIKGLDWWSVHFLFFFCVLLCCLFFCCILLEERVKVVTEDDLSLLTSQAPLIRLVVHSFFVKQSGGKMTSKFSFPICEGFKI